MTKQTEQVEETKFKWVVPVIKWIIDATAAVVILALAIKGASNYITAGNEQIQIGAAVFLVGFLAIRLIERLFSK